MSQFIVRIELHKMVQGEPDYKPLHDAMKAKGFSRTIKLDDGILYRLPPAEYFIEGDYTGETISDMAKDAANSVDEENAVLVSGADTIWASGLKPVSFAGKKILVKITRPLTPPK